jgi:hypothetical protein
MVKIRKSDGDYTISETGNWNVADSFSKVKVMRPLENCELYEDIATYGHDSFFGELIRFDMPTDELKIMGLKRLTNELIRLCKNARFAMKKPGTKEQLKKYEEKLRKIKNEILEFTYAKTINQVQGTSNLKIRKENFEKVLELLTEIKADINDPLNKNHLIFTDKEEFDPRAFKERIRQRIVNKG